MPRGGPRLDYASQKKFLDHLFRESLVRLGTPTEYDERVERLRQLATTVNNGTYQPYPDVGLLSMPKSKGIPRFVPVFSLRDYVVYYGCVAAIDEQLAAEAVPDTFGGWSLGGARRRAEGERAQELIREATDDAYAPASPYNPAAWVNEWNQFWKLLALIFETASDSSYFVTFDVANFYDSVDLPRLEREIRDVCPGQGLAIEVLIYLLGSWNTRLTSYSRGTKGLPQDLVGDCSRVLANAYLTPYDKAMRSRARAANARYVRYADDMLFAGRTRSACERLLFQAADELNQLGLNVNVSKVEFMTKNEFQTHWGFEIMTALDSPQTVGEGIRLLRESWDTGRFSRRETAIRRALSQLMRLPGLADERAWVHSTLLSDRDLVLGLSDRQMNGLISIAAHPKQTMEALAQTVLAAPFSGPKVRLFRAMERAQTTRGLMTASKAIGKQIASDGDPTISLAVKRSRDWARRK